MYRCNSNKIIQCCCIRFQSKQWNWIYLRPSTFPGHTWMVSLLSQMTRSAWLCIACGGPVGLMHGVSEFCMPSGVSSYLRLVAPAWTHLSLAPVPLYLSGRRRDHLWLQDAWPEFVPPSPVLFKAMPQPSSRLSPGPSFPSLLVLGAYVCVTRGRIRQVRLWKCVRAGGGGRGAIMFAGGYAGGTVGRRKSILPSENLQIPKPAGASGVRKSSSSSSGGKMLSMSYSESIRSGISRYHSDQGLNQPPRQTDQAELQRLREQRVAAQIKNMEDFLKMNGLALEECVSYQTGMKYR